MDNLLEFYHSQAEVFVALAHPVRLEILELLREGEACVCHIQARLDQRQAYVSQHLNVLRHAGLVSNRKEGLRVYYQVTTPGVFAILEGCKELLVENGRLDPADLQAVASRSQQLCNCPQCVQVAVRA